MATNLSKTRVDRLGNRLRKGVIISDDLRLLDEYRASFGNVYDFAVGRIREHLKLEPTGKPTKSTHAIIEKLKRESIRLTQIQDITGCRIVVDGIKPQNRIVYSLQDIFSKVSMIDRRGNPSHGYRAVHLIVKVEGKAIEIQVRTTLQHRWAELSEKLADVYDANIKYGGGEQNIQEELRNYSEEIGLVENLDERLSRLEKHGVLEEHKPELLALRKEQTVMERSLLGALTQAIQGLKQRGSQS